MPSDAWQMPQGGLDAGEHPDDALWREMREEIGTDAAEIVARAGEWLSYDLPEDMAGKVWGGRYAGQLQLWYLLRFTGREDALIWHPTMPSSAPCDGSRRRSFSTSRRGSSVRLRPAS